MACCNLPLGAHWPVVILVLAMNALGASSPAVSRRPTPQTDVPVWAVLLSHFPGQTVYKLADQPLVLAWRVDLDAVQVPPHLATDPASLGRHWCGLTLWV